MNLLGIQVQYRNHCHHLCQSWLHQSFAQTNSRAKGFDHSYLLSGNMDKLCLPLGNVKWPTREEICCSHGYSGDVYRSCSPDWFTWTVCSSYDDYWEDNFWLWKCSHINICSDVPEVSRISPSFATCGLTFPNSEIAPAKRRGGLVVMNRKSFSSAMRLSYYNRKLKAEESSSRRFWKIHGHHSLISLSRYRYG